MDYWEVVKVMTCAFTPTAASSSNAVSAILTLFNIMSFKLVPKTLYFLKHWQRYAKLYIRTLQYDYIFLRIYSIQGSTTVKRLPRPSSERSSMRPPIFSTMSTQMDKPSPTPWENSLRL